MNLRPSRLEQDRLPCEGDIIAGRYQIDQVLGHGGMGLVVAAQHIALRQKVAVKFLLPEAMETEGASERFLREAQAAAAIQSEHVARVLDVGSLESGAPYMVMEYLRGVHLGQLLRARGTLPLRDAVDYILQACEAMAEAHALGIIHRDLKPANLFLTTRADGSPLIKVLDFGLSKPIRADAPSALDVSLTGANIVLGSPHYMSPEQVRCLKSIDARTDIWSLGVILYQMLTGQRPFEADAMTVMCAIISSDPLTPLHACRPDLPPALADVVMRCLEKDVSRRVQSVAELARALAPFGFEGVWVSVERISRVLAEHAQPVPALLAASGPPTQAVVPAAPGAGHIGAFDSPTPMASTIEDDIKRSTPPLPPLSSASHRRNRSSVALAISTALSVVALGAFAAMGFNGSLSTVEREQRAPAVSGDLLTTETSAPAVPTPLAPSANATLSASAAVSASAASAPVEAAPTAARGLPMPAVSTSAPLLGRLAPPMTAPRPVAPALTPTGATKSSSGAIQAVPREVQGADLLDRRQ